MDTIVLGRTGLEVNVAGLGTASSRVGKRSGLTEDEGIAIVRQGVDAGITLIDSAEGYGTEEIVGKGIQHVDRSSLVLCTKKTVGSDPTPLDVEKSLEESLRKLGTDYLDIYCLHAVQSDAYEEHLERLVPTFIRLKEQGKIRFLGITEAFGQDPQHAMLTRALEDDIWDVMMVGFHIVNQTAREAVFSGTQKKNIGVLIMCAIRGGLGSRESLVAMVRDLIEKGQLDPNDLDLDDPLGFLVDGGQAEGSVDASYRFCRDEPGVHVVLSGTKNPEHLKSNLSYLAKPAFPEQVVAKLKHIFRNAHPGN